MRLRAPRYPGVLPKCPNRKQLDWNFHDYLAYQAKLLQYRQKSEYPLCVSGSCMYMCMRAIFRRHHLGLDAIRGNTKPFDRVPVYSAFYAIQALHLATAAYIKFESHSASILSAIEGPPSIQYSSRIKPDQKRAVYMIITLPN